MAFQFEETNDKIGILYFDLPGEKVNKFNTAVMTELQTQADMLSSRQDLAALIFMSRKEDSYIAGADVNEIRDLTDPERGYEVARQGQEIFDRFSRMPFPTIAVINGACMGGGTEISLACQYRLVTDHPKTSMALPEVNLGILPGWGGTTRLPRMIGLQRSLDIILTGRKLNPKRAYRLRVADKIIPAEWALESALAFAREIIDQGGQKYIKKRRPQGLMTVFLEKTPFGRNIMFSRARQMVLKKTGGQYPAPLRAIQVLQQSHGKPFNKALELEARALGDLIVTPICKSLVQIFLWTQEIKKENGSAHPELQGQLFHKAGTLGAGAMGGGIAQLFASKEIFVRVKDINTAALAGAYKQAAGVLRGKLKRRRITKYTYRQILQRISGTTDYSGFKNTDIVIEAIVEDLEIKKKVLKELEQQVSDKTIIATNTSSLRVDEMAEALQNKERFAGMHFFNPVHRMPLVEVVKGKHTGEQTIVSLFELAKKLGKTPIVVKDAPGFLVNRLLVPYMVEAISMLEEGYSMVEIDKAMLRFGMPMGPIALFDEVGIDVAFKVAKILQKFMGNRMAESAILEQLIAEKRLGKKTGSGFYRYSGRTKEPLGTYAISRNQSAENRLQPEQMVQRMVYPMVNEAARCLEESLVGSARDVDIGMIFGTGFAPFRGGLLKYADSEGLNKIVEMLEKFTGDFGKRFTVSKALQNLAKSGRGFYKV